MVLWKGQRMHCCQANCVPTIAQILSLIVIVQTDAYIDTVTDVDVDVDVDTDNDFGAMGKNVDGQA